MESDNDVLIKEAFSKETIPKYLFKTEEGVYVDFFKIIKEDSLENILKLYNNYDKLKKLNLKDDIYIPYIIYNLYKNNEPYNESIYFYNKDTIGKELEKEDILEDLDIDNIWSNKNIIINNINKLISQNKETYNNLYIILESTKSKIYTNFEIDKEKFNFNLVLNNIDIYELFNSIIVNIQIPFVRINKIHKILNNFKPCKEWADERPVDAYEDNIIYIKILNKEKNEHEEKEDDDYTEIFIEKIQNNINVQFDYYDNKYMDRDKYINTFLSIFPTKIMYKEFNYNRIEGTFYFPNFSFKNKYIFYDMLINNDLFSSMMSIDEHVKATKDKKDVYIHFNNDNVGKLTANVTEQIVTNDDKYLKKQDKKLFEIGKPYIRIKVSIPDSPKKNIDYITQINIKQIESFQEIFSKYLTIYDEKYNEIFDIYNKFINDFDKKIDKDTTKHIDRKNKKLKDIVPKLFVAGYPTSCLYKPNIIDINEYKDDIEYVMKFPKDGDTSTKVEQKYYTCSNNELHKFPGLIPNTLDNKDISKYLPCCFKINQKNKGNYSKYLGVIEDEIKVDIIQQKIISKNRILDFGIYGNLSANLIKIFNMFEDTKVFSYKRKGLLGTQSSLIDCIYEAIENKPILDKQKRNIYINELRQTFATNEYASLCRQEMYDFSIENIIEKIKSTDYFDPKYFIRILEYHYKCKIFIFNDDELLARNVQNKYYESNNNDEIVFIYEHKDKNICELIIRNKNNDSKDNDYSFHIDTNIYINMNDIYNKINLTKEHIDLTKIFNIKWQYIDSYGKTRMVCIILNGIDIVLFTEPIQPLYCKTLEKDDEELNIKANSEEDINMLLESIKNVKTEKNDKNKITFVLDDTINITIFKKLDNISVLKNYNKYKKLSKYIMEYFYWLYSTYLNDDSITEKSYEIFCDIYIKIDKDFEYNMTQVNNEFNIKNNGIMVDNKLIIKSSKTLKKMNFLLDLMIEKYTDKLLNYYKLKYIENFYTEITDFETYSNQCILYGINTIDKILQI